MPAQYRLTLVGRLGNGSSCAMPCESGRMLSGPGCGRRGGKCGAGRCAACGIAETGAVFRVGAPRCPPRQFNKTTRCAWRWILKPASRQSRRQQTLSCRPIERRLQYAGVGKMQQPGTQASSTKRAAPHILDTFVKTVLSQFWFCPREYFQELGMMAITAGILPDDNKAMKQSLLCGANKHKSLGARNEHFQLSNRLSVNFLLSVTTPQQWQ
ncbi:uncharacterized protein [Dermacentor andersoni]|uniref:uncharacterized protein isoform X2 n=1 Tax=Dermacentor andersoni TaxID=34620 RepID=UPI002417964F|nr:uncharacterized protein LOC126539424 isoform X2 [Dermacentor andersoni]